MRHPVPGTVIVAMAVCLPLSAFADATVVSETRMEGAPSLPNSASAPSGLEKRAAKATVRYKAGAMRTESENGAVIVTPQRMIFIDDADRKWSATSPAKASSAANPLLGMVDFKTEATVRPTGKTSTILGKLAKQWLVDAVVRIKMPDLSGLMGGGSGDAKPKPAAASTAVVRVRTEVWATEAVDVGGNVAFLGGAGGAPGANLLKPMLEKMRAIRGLPLRVSMVQTLEGGFFGKMAGKPIRVRTDVVSIDERPLAAEWFAPPKGYKQVPYVPDSFMNLPLGAGRMGNGGGNP
ncbi:MAG: hypothetical protein ACKO5K_04280 [Armatimonadota bacterium]